MLTIGIAGKKFDKAGKAIIQKLETCQVDISDYSIISDGTKEFQEKVLDLYAQNTDLIILTGLL